VPRDLIIPLLFCVVVLLLLLWTYPMEILTLLSLGYLLSIPFAVRRYRSLSRAEEERAAPSP
jgi:CDP-diacylglycerol--serine O-phosphatidyltransferase